jgi:hypothetical protein
MDHVRDRLNRPPPTGLCQSCRFDAKDSFPFFFDRSRIVTYIPLSLWFRVGETWPIREVASDVVR